MPYFTQVTDDEGNVTYVEVDENDLVSTLVTEDVIKQSEPYQTVLTETITRRNTIKTLKEALADKDQVDDISEDKKEEVKQASTVAPLNKDELFAEFTAKLAEKEAETARIKAEQQVMIKRVADKYKVPASLLRGSTEAELTEHANLIADETNAFKSLGANPTTTEYGEDFWAKLDEKSSWGTS